MNRNALWMLLGVALLGQLACSPPPPAPEELNEFFRFVFREWENPDPRVLQVAMEKFEKLPDIHGLTTDEHINSRSFSFEKLLKREDLEGIEPIHDRDPQVCTGVGVIRASPHSVELHGKLQTDKDQLPAEPSAKSYERSFTTDEKCFRKQTCEVLRTKNKIVRSNLLMSVEMTLYKDFRWVELSDGRKALVARSWAPKTAKELGNSMLSVHQSYSVDFVLPFRDGQVWRFQGTVTETEGAGTGGDAEATILKDGTDEGLEAADDTIEERYGKKK